MRHTTTALALLVGVSCGTTASTTTLGAESMIGHVVAPKAELTLRAEPPGAFFKPKGSAIGVVAPLEEYRVIDQRNLFTIFGTQQWIRVEPQDGSSPSGWLFNGDGESGSNVIQELER